MKCFECGGGLKEGTTTVTLQKNGKPVMIENVPAKICQQCGEEYIAGPTTEKLSKALDHPIHISKKLTIPVVGFASIAL